MNLNKTIVLIGLLGICVSINAYAGDKKYKFELNQAIENYRSSQYYISGVKVYFGNQSHPDIDRVIETIPITLRTSRTGKSNPPNSTIPTESALEQAERERYRKICGYVFSVILKKMQVHARNLGADAIVNVVSNFKDIEYSSEYEYECYRGVFHTAVSLRGDYVKLK